MSKYDNLAERQFFFRFLKNNRVRDKFAINSNQIDFSNGNRYVAIYYSYLFLNSSKPEFWIDRAFVWNKTKEGHEFWQNASIKWRERYLKWKIKK